MEMQNIKDIRKSKVNKIYPLAFALFCFYFSLYIFPYYTDGDQYHYIKFYEGIGEYGFKEAYSFYGSATGAQEPIYFFLVFLMHSVVEKEVLFSILNAVFVYFLTKLLLRERLYPFIIFCLFFNFYFLVLFFSAERLKLAVLFAVLGLYYEKKKYGTLFFIISLITHLQSIILIISLRMKGFLKLMKSFLAGNFMRMFIVGAIIISVIFVGFIYLQNQIIYKLQVYSENGGFINIIKPTILMLLTVFFNRKKTLLILLTNFPLIIASILLGEERIVIFSYFIMLYHTHHLNRGFNVPVILTSCYFIYQGFGFLEQIIEFGDGFYNIQE